MRLGLPPLLPLPALKPPPLPTPLTPPRPLSPKPPRPLGAPLEAPRPPPRPPRIGPPLEASPARFDFGAPGSGLGFGRNLRKSAYAP